MNRKRALISCTNCVVCRVCIVGRSERDVITNVLWSLCKYRFCGSGLLTLDFSRHSFTKHSHINTVMTIRASCYMRSDGRTDMTKLLDDLWKSFYSTCFIITGTFRDCTNYYNNLCCSWAEFGIYTSINIGKWTHCSHQLYAAVDCHRYCPVDLLWQETLFPMKRKSNP